MGYQQIDIGGFYHKGKDRTKDYYQIFNDRPIGLSILDIGCHNGFYILKAISEGARYAVGVDRKGRFLEVGRKAKKFLEYDNIKFIESNVLEDGLPEGTFDIVVCLNILHYFSIKQIDDLLEKIDKQCSNMMVFEVLDCGENWKYDKIPTGKTRTFLSEDFFRQKFESYKIESMDSLVTEGRKIIKVKK